MKASGGNECVKVRKKKRDVDKQMSQVNNIIPVNDIFRFHTSYSTLFTLTINDSQSGLMEPRDAMMFK